MAHHHQHAGPDANDTLAVIEQLEDMALDPTLDQCCRRDLQEQIRTQRIKHSLQLGDRAEARQRLAASTIRSNAHTSAHTPTTGSLADSRAPQHQQPHAAQHEPPSAPQQAADTDAELQQLRQQRLQQMRAQAAVQQEQRQEGFRSLNTVQEGHVLKLCCQDPPGRGLVVLHLAVQGYEPCNALDEVLQEAAEQYRGTYFARCVTSRSSPLVPQLQLPHGIPALLVAKGGVVLGKASINQFGGEDIWEEEVLSYLRRFKVLSAGGVNSSSSSSSVQHATQPRRGVSDGGSSGGDSSGSDAEGAEGDWQTPCEVCGRTYPHEHIRAIYSSTQADSDED